MEIQVVICTHNNEDIIERCLKSVYALKLKKGWKLSVLVVDDASTDGTVKAVKAFKKVRIFGSYSNIGPAACRNTALACFDPDYYFFIDSDVVLDKDCLIELMNGFDVGIGIVGPKLLLPDGKINSIGGGLTKSGFGFDIGYGSVDWWYLDTPADCMYICSAAMLMKKAVVDTIGMFDSAYFYGHEDTDYGWRANLAGIRVRYIPKAKATHYKGSTINKDMGMVYYHATKNRFRSILKNYNFFNVIIYGSLYILLSMGDIIFRRYRKEKIKAWLWSIAHLFDTFKERAKVQRTRMLRDSELKFEGVIKW